MGLADSKHFAGYHGVLNRARWSPWVLSKSLLSLIIRPRLPAGAPLVLLIDETLERRQGRKIKYKGWFRDPIRSTMTKVTKALGICCICLAILVPVPWSQRLWALPFMTVPALSPKTSAKFKKRHRTLVGWATTVTGEVQRWQPDRKIVLAGDGSYAAVVLVRRCQRLKQPVKLVSRLCLDACLHDFPGPQLFPSPPPFLSAKAAPRQTNSRPPTRIAPGIGGRLSIVHSSFDFMGRAGITHCPTLA